MQPSSIKAKISWAHNDVLHFAGLRLLRSAHVKKVQWAYFVCVQGPAINYKVYANETRFTYYCLGVARQMARHLINSKARVPGLEMRIFAYYRHKFCQNNQAHAIALYKRLCATQIEQSHASMIESGERDVVDMTLGLVPSRLPERYRQPPEARGSPALARKAKG